MVYVYCVKEYCVKEFWGVCDVVRKSEYNELLDRLRHIYVRRVFLLLKGECDKKNDM